jgi:serine protease Do
MLMGLALVAALGLGAALQRSGAIGDEPRNKEINPTALRHAEELSDAFANAAQVAMPSVVTIRSKTKPHALARGRSVPKGENPFKGTPFEDLFDGRGFENFGPQITPRREGMGSGVIIDSTGIVLTNNHVVDGADEVVVHLADGRQFKGENIKTDEHTDLAVIHISGAGTLPAAKLGDSDKSKIGDWVMAIGNPFGFEQTVSSGIISGLGRELGEGGRARFLQTDAAINPGNSGGPLINLRGEVIGINTAIASNNGSFNGLGFAIPVNTAKWVTTQLVGKGKVDRAFLGIGLEEISPELAEQLGVRHGEGVLVAEVFPKTPASEAGFEVGDVVTKFGDQKVKDHAELRGLVERVAVDTPQDVEILRNGKAMTLHVTPKALPKQFGIAERPQRSGRADSGEAATYEDEELGIEVADLTSDQSAALGYKGQSGVLITKVDPDKVAADRGLAAGMLILKAGKKSVKNVFDFKAAVKGESLKSGILLLVRNPKGVNAFIVLKE